jgi:hypothetical protein
MSRTAALQVDQRTIDRIVAGLKGLQFGTLEIVIHDSKVVRITRSEKVRLDQSNGSEGNGEDKEID